MKRRFLKIESLANYEVLLSTVINFLPFLLVETVFDLIDGPHHLGSQTQEEVLLDIAAIGENAANKA